MSKKVIVKGGIGLLVLLLIGAGGAFGYMTYTELTEYKKLGSLNELKNIYRDNTKLKKQNKEYISQASQLQKQFAIFRQKYVDEAQKRAQRKIELTKASFTSLSGAYVITALATQEQLENCMDVQNLIKFEMKNFEDSAPELMMQQDKVCETYIEPKILPLYKYQMLRVKATLKNSLGNFRPETEEKFKNAQKLLQQWNVPVNPEMDRYIRF